MARKVTYHVFKLYPNGHFDRIYENFDFDSFLNYINALPQTQRRYTISDTKFCSLDYFIRLDNRHNNRRVKCYFGCIKSAVHGSKKNLIDSVTNNERINPKEQSEGEREDNYFVLAFNNEGEFEIIFQNAHNGITPQQFKNYLETYMDSYIADNRLTRDYGIDFGDIIIEDPQELIRRLDRIVECKVYIDKNILGSDYLGLTNRTLSVKSDLIVDIKADYSQSIDQAVLDIYQNLRNNTQISKMWVRGKDNESNESKFFIERIQKTKFINITLDPVTKSLVRDSARSELINLI
jgi:hypothetical protein